MTEQKKTLEQFAIETASARFAEKREIARQNSALRATVEKQAAEIADVQGRPVLSILDPLAAGIRLLQSVFSVVNIDAVVGNHGRRTLKPITKNRAQDNFDWLVYQLLQRYLVSNVPGVTMRVASGPDARVTVHG